MKTFQYSHRIIELPSGEGILQLKILYLLGQHFFLWRAKKIPEDTNVNKGNKKRKRKPHESTQYPGSKRQTYLLVLQIRQIKNIFPAFEQKQILFRIFTRPIHKSKPKKLILQAEFKAYYLTI
jgi:hypothetical protein